MEDNDFQSGEKNIGDIEEKSKGIIKMPCWEIFGIWSLTFGDSPMCGAVSLFLGTTGNNFKGKKVITLEYEVYISMAENEIKKICSDIR